MTRESSTPEMQHTEQNKQLAQAIALHQQGDLEGAEQVYRAILSGQPHHPDALHLLGLIAQAKGNYAQALRLIEEAIDQDARQPVFYNNLGNVLLEDGQFEGAIQAFETARSIDPNFDEALYNLANAYQKAKQIEKAIACYEKYLKGHPDHVEANYNLGKALKSLGSFSQARECLERVVGLKSQFFNGLIELAVLCELENDWEAALTHYQRACVLKPEDIEVWNAMGHAYQVQGKFNNAIRSYRTALNQDPLHTETLFNLFTLLRNRGFDKQATDLVKLAIEAHPDYQHGYFLLGSFYLEKYKLNEAETYLQQAITLDPRNANAYNLLGLVNSEKGCLSKARYLYRHAIKNTPHPAGALNNLGRDLINQGRYQAGVSCYKTALKMSPRSPEMRSNFIYFNHYDDRVTREELFTFTQKWWEVHGAPLNRPTHFANDSFPNRKLRIGYVSPDFRRHSVSYFFLPLLQSHDRSQFEIICYSQVHRPDEITERIARLADGWCATTGLRDGV